MGVVGEPDSTGLEIDYKLSTEEIYLAVAIHNLENLKNLELLANAAIHSASKHPNLPSWVPDCEYMGEKSTTLDYHIHVLTLAKCSLVYNC
jgi:hypothetical protein